MKLLEPIASSYNGLTKTNVLLSLRDKTVPLISAKKSSLKPWFRRKHRSAKARKNRAYAVVMKTKSPAHLAVFKKEGADPI